MLQFHKILPLLLLPPGFCLVLLVVGVALRRRPLLWTGIVMLWVFSMPVVGDGLMRYVEGGMKRVPAAAVGGADAIVVLSGMVEQVAGAPLGEWGEAADRYEGGLELYRAGKAPLLVFTGGHVLWQPAYVPEGALLEKRAVRDGVPVDAIRVSGKVGNTAEEAVAVRKMLGASRIILVTSAFHMPRSVALFRRQGFMVRQFPVDFRVSGKKRMTVQDLLPDAAALEQSSMALRELMGRAFYLSGRKDRA